MNFEKNILSKWQDYKKITYKSSLWEVFNIIYIYNFDIALKLISQIKKENDIKIFCYVNKTDKKFYKISYKKKGISPYDTYYLYNYSPLTEAEARKKRFFFL
jgi:hypothetical protein